MKQALFYEKDPNGSVRCLLCPHSCKIKEGERGICGVRKNINGQLFAETYGRVTALHSDPIEKKPLYHYHPGDYVFSIGSLGCNLHCSFCQNSEISQSNFDDFPFYKSYTPDDIIDLAKQNSDIIGIAYTYNEPTVYYEFMYDTAKKAKANKLLNIVVTNGFINKAPLEQLMEYTDAFSVDLKAFTESFYKKYTGSSLAPVKETIKTIKANGKHIELINLVIPTLNDDKKTFEEMVKWINDETGNDTVLHLSRYFPRHKLTISPTPVDTLKELKEIADQYLQNVYLGNV